MGETEERASELSRSVLFELISLPSGLLLQRIGQWEQDSSALTSGLHVESNGTHFFYNFFVASPLFTLGALTLFWTTQEGHFLVQDIDLSARYQHSLQPQYTNTDSKQVHGPHLSIPNAFKSMMAKSTEHLPPLEKGSAEPVKEKANLLSEHHDVGCVILESSLRGLETRKMNDGTLKGIVWNSKEVAVSDAHKPDSFFCVVANGLTFLDV